jgi:two-component system cell cycle response regulator DivK
MTPPQRILIVDDLEDHRIILRLQLRRIAPFEILEATNGQEALQVIAQQEIDLVFLNLGLPVLDGWEAARRIRALASPARDVPIIAFTAYALPGDEQKARDAGCDDYLAKPLIDRMLLHQKVQRFLPQPPSP